jgi:toxin ParE1/3/4
MSLSVILDPEARTEFDEAYDWYEGQRSGLGEKFAEAVQRVLDRIAVLPQMHGKVFGEVRKALVSGFPYCVYYHAESTEVRVIAIFHTSRDPSIWQKRVDPT